MRTSSGAITETPLLSTMMITQTSTSHPAQVLLLQLALVVRQQQQQQQAMSRSLTLHAVPPPSHVSLILRLRAKGMPSRPC